ncbi:putative Deoxyhypusine synthase [Paratrimastix pyriformis]|uniref:Deoxyhypusine synthase n=1 Tax=Paratrimastix pyriformis TaxID=342808 RepID=A0ABQ8UEW5_9EUKA|nr:putative Deoxyhypusine synthase [Paratrimastix pyriformis]
MQPQQQQKEEQPTLAKEAVLVQSVPMTDGIPVRGYDFNRGLDYAAMLDAFATTGFQATSFGRAVDEVNRMLHWRLSQEPIKPDEDDAMKIMANREKVKTTIFLGYTSNLVSAGTRDTIRFLAQHHLVDAIVTTTGGIEEDFIKCLAPTFLGDFELDFEDWINPILLQILNEQKSQHINWTPSKIIDRLGREINNPESIYYWCHRNQIPVFCPAFTDGSIGDMIFFFSFNHPGLVVDLVEDIRKINMMAMKAPKTGMVILGGGVIKHHICNANLMRNGADFSVYMNTAQEFDGSDAGARPDEAKSWGKIRANASAVKVYGECTLLFPLLVAQTFAKAVFPPAASAPATATSSAAASDAAATPAAPAQ